MRVLRRNGCEVVVPRDQVCCGALSAHNGERESARGLARQNLKIFQRHELDAIVVNAAGCGSTLKEYADLLCASDDADVAPRERVDTERFSARVKDIHEFLASIGLARPLMSRRRRVTFQDSCHLLHGQRIATEPRRILAAIPGLEVREMARPDLCCGSAGSYSLTEPGMAARLLDDKMADVSTTGCDTLATANPGCLLQLERGARERGLDLEVKHVIELLDEAYSQE
jgi:glycolate oxidase iron-sulfur subunit